MHKKSWKDLSVINLINSLYDQLTLIYTDLIFWNDFRRILDRDYNEDPNVFKNIIKIERIIKLLNKSLEIINNEIKILRPYINNEKEYNKNKEFHNVYFSKFFEIANEIQKSIDEIIKNNKYYPFIVKKINNKNKIKH